MTQKVLRQGDVLLVPTTQRPSAKAKSINERGRIILAHGEVTGHQHEVIGIDNADPVPAMELFEEPDGTRLLVISQPSELRHDEHGRIPLAPGGYTVIRQSEYDPIAVRQVAD